MALNSNTLGTMIKTEIEAVYGPADDSARLLNFCNAIAKAVVDHIQASAVVTVTGVQTGGSSASGSVN